MAHEHNLQSTGTAKTAETDAGDGVGCAAVGAGRVSGAGRIGALAGASLIPEARKAWRLLSVQVALIAVIFGALPVDQQTAILELLGVGPERIPAFLGLAVIVARLVAQPKAQA